MCSKGLVPRSGETLLRVDVVPTVDGVKFQVDRWGGHYVVDSVNGCYLRLDLIRAAGGGRYVSFGSQ